ncbi:hypothetical protein J2X66_002829 [Pseudomonas sp. 3296]|nr:hypothetical protein [Pseudomonas sp. 3296]
MHHTYFRRNVPAHYSLIGLTLALSAGSATVAQADENSGFIEGAAATLNLRNACINRTSSILPTRMLPPHKTKRRNGRKTLSSMHAPAIPKGR